MKFITFEIKQAKLKKNRKKTSPPPKTSLIGLDGAGFFFKNQGEVILVRNTYHVMSTKWIGAERHN